MIFLASDKQRRLPSRIRLVLVGTRLDQQLHDLEVIFLASDKQRGHTINISRPVLVRARVLQQSHNLEVIFLASDKQRRLP